MPFWQFYQKLADWLDWPCPVSAALHFHPKINDRKWLYQKLRLVFCHLDPDPSNVQGIGLPSLQAYGGDLISYLWLWTTVVKLAELVATIPLTLLPPTLPTVVDETAAAVVWIVEITSEGGGGLSTTLQLALGGATCAWTTDVTSPAEEPATPDLVSRLLSPELRLLILQKKKEMGMG